MKCYFVRNISRPKRNVFSFVIKQNRKFTITYTLLSMKRIFVKCVHSDALIGRKDQE